MVYVKCNRCRCDKTENRNPYCKSCSREYFAERRKQQRNKDFSMKEFKIFIEKVVSNDFNVEFDDINEIIGYYRNVTNDLYEYNNLSSNEQIVKMWNRIFDYYKRYK
jgi:hypothetical protein